MNKHVLVAIDFVWPRMRFFITFLSVANTQSQLDLFHQRMLYHSVIVLLRILKHQNHFAYGPINLKQWLRLSLSHTFCFIVIIRARVRCMCVCSYVCISCRTCMFRVVECIIIEVDECDSRWVEREREGKVGFFLHSPQIASWLIHTNVRVLPNFNALDSRPPWVFETLLSFWWDNH